MAFQDRNRNRPNRRNRGGGGKPDVPTRREWINADPIFTNTRENLNLQFGRYGQAANRATNRLNVDTNTALREMAIQKRRDLASMKEDYASRGLAASPGLYGRAQIRYGNDYNRQVEAAERARARGLKDIDVGLEDQRLLKTQQMWNARNEALLRRIQKYGLPAPGA